MERLLWSFAVSAFILNWPLQLIISILAIVNSCGTYIHFSSLGKYGGENPGFFLFLFLSFLAHRFFFFFFFGMSNIGAPLLGGMEIHDIQIEGRQ